MKHALSTEGRKALFSLSRSRALLAFDFDGTLSPIRDDRAAAAMRASTRVRFVRACAWYPAAVLSGRSSEDVRPRLGGALVRYVVGNHGAEPGASEAACEAAVRAALPSLRTALAAVEGVEIEDKRCSLALHYRRARRPDAARDAIERALGATALRAVGGKFVVNGLAPGAPHKGDALRELLVREGAEAALYVGDDVTDEDAFALAESADLVAVRVGAAKDTAARFHLRDQLEIDALLDYLVGLRSGGP